MSPLEIWGRIDWRRVGKAVLRIVLDRAGWLLIQSGHLERLCGERLRQLSARLKPGR